MNEELPISSQSMFVMWKVCYINMLHVVDCYRNGRLAARTAAVGDPNVHGLAPALWSPYGKG